MTPTPCFVCGKELDSAANDELMETVPYKGTQFTTPGHYGSTVFDPNFTSFDGMLEVNICDDCLVERKERVVYLRRIIVKKPRANFKRGVWEP